MASTENNSVRIAFSDSDCETPMDEMPSEIQHTALRAWWKYGKSVLLATFVVSAVAACGIFAMSITSHTLRSDARQALGLEISTETFGHRVSELTAGKGWTTARATFNAIATDGYTGDAAVVETGDFLRSQTPAKQIKYLTAMKNACDAGGSPCTAVDAALLALSAAAPTPSDAPAPSPDASSPSPGAGDASGAGDPCDSTTCLDTETCDGGVCKCGDQVCQGIMTCGMEQGGTSVTCTITDR